MDFPNELRLIVGRLMNVRDRHVLREAADEFERLQKQVVELQKKLDQSEKAD